MVVVIIYQLIEQRHNGNKPNIEPTIYQLIEQRHNGNKPNIEPTHTSKLAVVLKPFYNT